MSRPDFVIVIAACGVVFAWYAIAHEWRVGVFMRDRWMRVHPYVVSYVRSSPATFLYAGVIMITTWVVAGSNQRLGNALLRAQSTNLSNLRHHAIDVLFRSAFWSGVPYALPVIAILAIVLAPAEFWLGTARVLAVFAIGHVGGTLLTAAGIALAVRWGTAPSGIERTIDVGVSYGTFCVAGVLAYRLEPAWRWLWIGGLLGGLSVVAGLDGSFADYGHLVSALLGLACYPLTRRSEIRDRARVPLYRPWRVRRPGEAVAGGGAR